MQVLTSFSTSSASPALEQEASTNRNIWGFVHTAVLHEHPPAASSADDAPDQITPYLAALQASHVFKSPHSAVAMAKTYGAADLLLGLSGSLLLPTSDSAAADQASDHIRQQINHAWSNEAVRRGVAAAKSGIVHAMCSCRTVTTLQIGFSKTPSHSHHSLLRMRPWMYFLACIIARGTVGGVCTAIQVTIRKHTGATTKPWI